MKFHELADDGERLIVPDYCRRRRMHASSALYLLLGCGQIALFNGDAILHHPPGE
jgi:hypothetical protein